MPISTPFNVLSGGLQDITPSGGVPVGGPGLSTDNALVRWNGTTGDLVQNGVVTEADFTGTLTGPTDQATTTAAGLAFTNQPANDGIEVLSSDAGDTTQTVTIIGTTNGTDTVVVETVTLTGTTPVATVKTNWGVVLAVKKSAVTLGTVTVREASADQTITAGLTAAVLSVGVTTVSNTAAFNRVLSMVASGATTKQLGFQGTNSAGTVIYDSQALTGTTVAVSNSQFLTLTEIYRGDLEATRTATVTTNGTWTLTGPTGQTLSFDSLTGGFSLTPSTDGRTYISANRDGSVVHLQNFKASSYGELMCKSSDSDPLTDGKGTSIGWFNGTDGASDAVAFGRAYIEAFDLLTATRPKLNFIQSNSSGHFLRQRFESDGSIKFYLADATFPSQTTSFTIGTTGNLLVAGIADGTGRLQFPAGAADKTSGITFHTDTNIFRGGAGNLYINAVTGSNPSLGLQDNGTSKFILQYSGGNTLLSGLTGSTIIQSNNATTLTLDSGQSATFANNVTLAGTALFTKPGGTIPLVTTNTAITDGAGVAAGTLLNSPTAGNPTKWVRINDNGTVRYIPAW